MILIFRNPYKIGIIDLILEMKKLKFKEIKEFMHIIQWWGLSAESIHLALWLQSHCDKPLSNSSSLWLQSQCDKSLSNSSSCYKLTLGNPVNHANLTNGFFILPERKECLFLKNVPFATHEGSSVQICSWYKPLQSQLPWVCAATLRGQMEHIRDMVENMVPGNRVLELLSENTSFFL